jgi:hypothetical protein
MNRRLAETLILTLAMPVFGMLGQTRPRGLKWPALGLPRRIQAELRAHLEDLGIDATPLAVSRAGVRAQEHQDTVTVRQLAQLRVRLGAIESLEVWRISRKGKDLSIVEDELTCVATLPPGLTLTRVPILTSTVRDSATHGGTLFEWRAFSWGNLPLVADRLRADVPLNRHLAHLLESEIPGELRIRAFPGDRVGISIRYDAGHLPSRDILDCFADIFRHVAAYVAERNRAREERDRL